MEIFMFSELGGGRSRIFYLDEKHNWALIAFKQCLK